MGRWNTWWFEREDARSLAAFRIAFALLVVWDIDGLGEHFELLFAPAGMFDAADARARFGGWANDAGVGAIVGSALRGRFSLLWLGDHEHALAIVLVALHASAAMLLLGRCTRPAALATVLLYDTLLQRNPVFWEGTEVVLRVFGVLLVCSRCGAVWSLDARRARARERSWAPPLVPAWPRRLMMVQLALLFLATGLLKQGQAWRDGDAVYYALASVHYARFDLVGELGPLGRGAIAVTTWFARTAELLFPLALVGVVVRGSTVWRRVLRRRIWLSAIVLLLLGMWLTMNIGVFHPAMLATLVVFFDGGEVGRALDRVRGRVTPDTVHAAAGLAYTPRVRMIGSVAIGIHLLALAATQLPAASLPAPLRDVASSWLAATRSTQSWGMWSTPPTTNVYLRAHIHSADGGVIELDVDLDPSRGERPAPLGYDRRWKIVGRMISSGPDGPYLRPFARWLCRHPLAEGEADAVELATLTVAIEPPTGGEPPKPATWRALATERCAD